MTDAADRPRMTLKSVKPIIKGALRGFATVQLPIGLVIGEIPVCTGYSCSWASLPSKPILDPDGGHVADKSGKKQYAPLLQWADRETADRWSAAVVDLVRAAHPDALDDARDNGHRVAWDLLFECGAELVVRLAERRFEPRREPQPRQQRRAASRGTTF